jgi:hypothetical protein
MRPIESLAQTCVSKHLGSECTPQTRPINRLNDLFVLARTLEGISGWSRKNPTYGMCLNTIQQTIHILPRNTWSGSVMHQHPIVVSGTPC